MNGQENNSQQLFQLRKKHFLIILPVVISVSILLILLVRTILNNSDSMKSALIINTPTLIPPSLFDQGSVAVKEILVKDAQKDFSALLSLYVSYFKNRESENLYLLLDQETQDKYSRDDLKNIINKSDFIEIKIDGGITWQVYSSGPNSVNNVTQEDEKVTLPEAGYLKATIPIKLVFSSKKEQSGVLSAKFQNEKWLFDFPISALISPLGNN